MKTIINKINTAVKSGLIRLLRMRRLALVVLACLIMASSLYLIQSIITARAESSSSANQMFSTSEQKLQSQIDDLSKRTDDLNEKIAQFLLQTQGTGLSTNSLTNQQILTEIEDLSTNTKKLTTDVDSLKAEIAKLQNKLKAAETTIGSLPMTVNGLSVVFITNDVEMGITGVNNTSMVQFAIKINNTTNSALANLDLTGKIAASGDFIEYLAPGFPQLVDGAGLFSYAYFIKGERELYFEAYSNAKTSFSVPAGGSVTLRPKMTVAPAGGKEIPPLSFNIGLHTITYDKVLAK